MMAIGLLHNVRSFLSSRPPLVVFIFCLGMMAIAFISFAYYIKLHDIRNPDVQKDWNTFLENITKVDFCLSNYTDSEEYRNSTYDIAHTAGSKNASIEISVSVQILVPMKSNSTFSSFTALVNGTLLGFSDAFRNSSVLLSVAPTQPYSPNCGKTEGCLWSMPACLSITGPHEIFPFSPRPVTCKLKQNRTDNVYDDGVLVPAADRKGSSQCSSAFLKLDHEEDEKLFVLLTVESRSRVQLRLLHSSYFIFVVIITVILLGIIRGGRHHHHDSPVHSNHRSRSPLLNRSNSP